MEIHPLWVRAVTGSGALHLVVSVNARCGVTADDRVSYDCPPALRPRRREVFRRTKMLAADASTVSTATGCRDTYLRKADQGYTCDVLSREGSGTERTVHSPRAVRLTQG